MKKAFGYAVVGVLLALPMVTVAADYRFGDQPSISASENVTTNAYLGGGSVASAGPVSGDVVAGGGSVLITGNVGGDILAGGGTVTVLSDVAGDVRVGGGTILLQGKVGGDLIVGGGQINIGGPGIAGDAVIGGGMVRLDAPVAGNVRGGGGNVYINAPIRGNITIQADTLTLGPSAVISGDLTYKASKELVKEEGAVVNGKVTFEQSGRKNMPTAAGIAAIISMMVIAKFLALFICALVIGLVFKRYSKEIISKATTRPWVEIGRGLVTIIMLPIVSILLFVTLVGIPFGILGLIALAALCIFTWIVAPIIVGSIVYRWITKKDEVSWKTILLGVFIVSVLAVIPFIGWLADGLLFLLALGAIVNMKWEIAREWR